MIGALIGALTGALTGEVIGPGPSSALALKEWGAVVHALLQGRQAVLLRKGGIHEKRFALRGSQFLLYPTVAHSHAESTRPEHADLLSLGAADVTNGAVTIRAAASVVEAIPVSRPDRVAELEPFHIWTPQSVLANRIDFRPRHQLTAIVVAVRPLSAPLSVAVLPEYAGCRSWVNLPADLEAVQLGRPVCEHADLMRVTKAVRAAIA